MASRNTLYRRTVYSAGKTDSATALVFPLSCPQQCLWLHYRPASASLNYIIPTVFRLRGKLDEKALAAAFNALILRHEVLRTYFVEQDGAPVQVIQSSLSIPLITLDLRGSSKELKSSELARRLHDNAATAFDLASLRVLQTQLLRLGAEEYIFLLAFHHMIFDDGSMGTLVRELSALYGAFSQGLPSPELPIQYAGYAVWQREWLLGELIARRLGYWKARPGNLPTLKLPIDRPRPAVQSFRGKTQQFSLSPDLTEDLKALGRRPRRDLVHDLSSGFSNAVTPLQRPG